MMHPVLVRPSYMIGGPPNARWGMAFNAALASRIEKGGDRDVAPYFAGREREMSHFDDALVEADYKKKQTVFRVFQGAPGCGKTSLLHHLRETRREKQGLLFVEVDGALENRADVLAHVVDAALATRAIRKPHGLREERLGEVQRRCSAIAWGNGPCQECGRRVARLAERHCAQGPNGGDDL